MTEYEVDYFHFEKNRLSFDDIGQKNGFRFWYARDFMKMLGYSEFSNFKKAINKAMTVCDTLNIDHEQNFKQITRNNQSDYCLSKFACYLIAMNGDVKKSEVAKAQAWFITYTEAFRQHVMEVENVERVAIRAEVSEREKSLSAAANQAGIDEYALFQNKGYLGLYNMNLKELKEHKGIPQKRSPLDFMGKEELAANLFRITQTEAKIRNEEIRGQKQLENTAFSVGQEIRKTMEKISGTRPEDLPIASDIQKIKSSIKSTQKEFVKLEKGKKQDQLSLPLLED